jgi:4-hydroxy-3-methylbut-2-enyl diphosphate reductase IspH
MTAPPVSRHPRERRPTRPVAVGDAHAGHEEVEGITGGAADNVLVVETVEDAERVAPQQADRVACVTQRPCRSTTRRP